MLMLSALIVLSMTASAQLPDEARAALNRGEAALQAALATYERQYPDRPLWQEAFAAGREAEALAPEALEPVRFLAEAYSRANWYGPAFGAWQRYLAAGGELDPKAAPLFAGVGTELGYTAYSRNDLQTALDYYLSVIDEVNYNTEAYVWAGRILLETGRPAEAIPYWQTVLERDATDERADYFLALAQDQAEWGVEANEAFRAGVRLYEENQTLRARERFARATVANPDYAEAWAWLGRTAFEMGDYPNAATYYREAASLEPSNQTYRYFLEESQCRAG